MRRFSWWSDLRTQHEALVEGFCVRISQRDRRTHESQDRVLRHAEALRLEMPLELRELLADPDRDPLLARERAEQRGWVMRWRRVPDDPNLAALRPRRLTELGFGKLSALRTDRAMLSCATMPMQLLGTGGQHSLAKPHHFATRGFAQKGRFALEQNGAVFVLDDRGQVLVSTVGHDGPYRLTPLLLDGDSLVVEALDPAPAGRHPELLTLMGERTRLRLDFVDGWVARNRSGP